MNAPTCGPQIKCGHHTLKPEVIIVVGDGNRVPVTIDLVPLSSTYDMP